MRSITLGKVLRKYGYHQLLSISSDIVVQSLYRSEETHVFPKLGDLALFLENHTPYIKLNQSEQGYLLSITPLGITSYL